MLRHSFLLIFRNARRFFGIFLINLFGLAAGLTCALLIYLWVKDELAVDAFYKNGDRLYHAWEHRKKADGIWTSPTTNGPLAQALKEEVPEVELSCVTTMADTYSMKVGEKEIKVEGRYVGPQFFELFSLPILTGKTSDDMKSVVISEKVATTLFGDAESALNKSIEIDHNEQFMVSGVFEDLPRAAREHFEFVLPFSKFESQEPWSKEWGSTAFRTYVLLREGSDINQVNAKIADFVSAKANDATKYKTLFLKPYKEIYLHSEYSNGVSTGGRIVYVKLFGVIAIFIVIIACVNFMNLSTAKSSQRIKEVGIKKAMGAGRGTLMIQHIGESLVISYLALALAILMTDLCLQPFNLITGKSLTLNFDPEMISVLVLIGLITGLFAGSYPALYVSSFKPATTLKGKLGSTFGEVWIRKGLVVFQFSLSVILIVSVLVVQSQISFVQHANIGYDRNNVLMVYREGAMWDGNKLQTFLTEAQKVPGVLAASVIGHDLTGHNGGTWGVVWEGKDPNDRTEFENISVGYNATKVFGFEMAEGRGFEANSPADSNKLVLNETAIKFMGLKNPIGARVKLWKMDMEIVGVVKDFHYESLHEPNKPLFFLLNNNAYRIAIKLDAARQHDAIAALEKLHAQLNPEFAFNYSFLDDQYQKQYAAEQRVSVLSRYFAGLAIMISSLGLLGLAAFTAERRTKEIGIRKVLGSSELAIVYLLTSEFTRIVLVAVLIAIPVSYFAAEAWLNTFAFRADLSAGFFVMAGLVALLVAWLTVSIQAYRAARVNPVSCLKDQ